MKLLDIALLGAGALLIGSAIKDKNPRDLIAEAVGQAKAKPVPSGPTEEDIRTDEEARGRARDTVANGRMVSN